MKEEALLYDLFIQVFRLGFTQSFRTLKELGVHPGQVPILSALSTCGKGPVQQSTLARELYLAPSTVAISLTRLENAGLILREKDPVDKRKYLVHLTDEGTRVMQVLLDEMHAFKHDFTKGFSKNELSTFASYLKRLKLNMLELERAQGIMRDDEERE